MTKREKGTTPLADGDRITWIREQASKQEVLQIRDRASDLTFRVRMLTQRPDGTGIVTTYGVPGAWLGRWVSELRDRAGDGAEVILSVEVV